MFTRETFRSSTPWLYKMFNHDVELALRKSLLFLLLMPRQPRRSFGERGCFLLLIRHGANFTNARELETKRIDSTLIGFVTIRVIVSHQ
jgi:hypothetical protein